MEEGKGNGSAGAATMKRRVDNLISKFVYNEPARQISVHATCDVLVVGSGPAGLSAAVAAARAGADVIIMERFGCMGGAIAHVGMETIGWYRYEGTVEGNGIGREMERRTVEMGGARKWAFNDSECLDAENFKLVADTLITENNIRPLLHSYVVDSITEPRVGWALHQRGYL